VAQILIAEDDDGVRNFVCRALAHAGHEVVETEDGGLASERITEDDGRFDLLLSDIKMPVMDGIVLALRRRRPLPRRHHHAHDGICRPARARPRARPVGLLSVESAKPFAALADLMGKVEDALTGKPAEIVSLARQAMVY